MKKLVIYTRVSTDQQSTERQIQELEKWASNNEFKVDKTFEESMSGFITERPAFEALRSYVKEHDIKQILCYELSRIGRSTLQIHKEIEYFKKEGVNIYFLKDNLDTISEDRTKKLMLTILAGMAELETSVTKERTKSGMFRSAEKGKRIGYGRMPLGYATDERGFIKLNDEEVNLVQEIFRKAASGLSAGQIAKDFNSRGILTYTAKMGKNKILKTKEIVPAYWNPKSIKNIIKSTRYKGFREYGKGKGLTGKILPTPRIVSDEIWNEANKKINDHLGYLSRTKYEYLFKSKITCGQCEYTLKSLRKYSKQGVNNKFKDVLYYTCQSYLHTHQNCDCGRFRSEVFDEYIYRDLFEKKDGLSLAFKKENLDAKRIELNKKLEYWDKEKNTATKEKKNQTRMFAKGYIDEEELDSEMSKIMSRMNEAESAIMEIEKSLKRLQSSQKTFKEMILQYSTDADFATKRSLVEEYVQRIRVFKVDKIDFDINKIHTIELNWKDKENIVQNINFVKPKKNEVIWYVEIWPFDEINPIKTLITSASGTNFVSSGLKFNKESRLISLDLNLKNDNNENKTK